MATGEEREPDHGETPHAGDVTRMLRRWREGDERVSEDLFAIVYQDLRRMAAGLMRDERDGHTLPPTGLVHEAYLRMVRDASGEGLAENRRHFFGVAARAMRRILVEHARRHAAEKRPSPRDAVPLEEARFATPSAAKPLLEILAVDEALEGLRAIHPRQAEVVELRYFAGLEESEVADVLGVSRATVTRDWRVARLLLRRSLHGAGPAP